MYSIHYTYIIVIILAIFYPPLKLIWGCAWLFLQAQEGNLYFTEWAERVEYGNYAIITIITTAIAAAATTTTATTTTTTTSNYYVYVYDYDYDYDYYNIHSIYIYIYIYFIVI